MPTLIVSLALLTLAAEPQGMRGVVVDEAGQPIEGALVILNPSASKHSSDQMSSTRSDAEGRFAFPNWKDNDEPWTILAHKPGLALGSLHRALREQRYLVQGDNPTPGNLVVVLNQPSRVRIRLQGPDGEAPPKGVTARLQLFCLNSFRAASFDFRLFNQPRRPSS